MQEYMGIYVLQFTKDLFFMFLYLWADIILTKRLVLVNNFITVVVEEIRITLRRKEAAEVGVL